jgi:hypothetical protein
MRKQNDRRLQGLALLKSHSYADPSDPPSLTDGAPGLVETSGLGSASLALSVDRNRVDVDAIFPPGPSKADIPAVWMIDPDGYSNWDGTIRGFARSLTSSLAMVGEPGKISIPMIALIQDFWRSCLRSRIPSPSMARLARGRGHLSNQLRRLSRDGCGT